MKHLNGHIRSIYGSARRDGFHTGRWKALFVYGHRDVLNQIAIPVFRADVEVHDEGRYILRPVQIDAVEVGGEQCFGIGGDAGPEGDVAGLAVYLNLFIKDGKIVSAAVFHAEDQLHILQLFVVVIGPERYIGEGQRFIGIEHLAAGLIGLNIVRRGVAPEGEGSQIKGISDAVILAEGCGLQGKRDLLDLCNIGQL